MTDQAISFEGVFPILVTPFDDRENPDLESFAHMVSTMAEFGMDGVTILGVLGEANRLTGGEREQLIATAVEAASGRIPVIVGTSHSGTAALYWWCPWEYRMAASRTSVLLRKCSRMAG